MTSNAAAVLLTLLVAVTAPAPCRAEPPATLNGHCKCACHMMRADADADCARPASHLCAVSRCVIRMYDMGYTGDATSTMLDYDGWFCCTRPTVTPGPVPSESPSLLRAHARDGILDAAGQPAGTPWAHAFASASPLPSMDGDADANKPQAE